RCGRCAPSPWRRPIGVRGDGRRTAQRPGSTTTPRSLRRRHRNPAYSPPMADGDRERWDARWRADAGATEPSPFLIALDALLPRAGAALDVAGGTGRNAVWLARRGLDVLCADGSPVAPPRPRGRAAAAGVALRT